MSDNLGFIRAEEEGGGEGGGRAGVGVYNVTTPPTSWIGYSWGSYEKIGDCKQSSKISPLWLAIWSADRNRIFFKPHSSVIPRPGLKICGFKHVLIRVDGALNSVNKTNLC